MLLLATERNSSIVDDPMKGTTMSNKPAPVEPDEDQDVIVHRMVQIEATTGLKQEIWTVWLEADKKDQYSTRVDAVRFACQQATRYRRPAWLDEDPASASRLKRICQ